MQFQTPLVPARLIRRYKRFLADIELQDGQTVTAHCANPGSMMGLADEGSKVWVEPNDDPKKKLKFGWRLIEHETGHFTGVDTSLANKVIKEALTTRRVPGLDGFDTCRPEVRYGANSRIDFLLSSAGLPDTYIEVKSVTLQRQNGLAEFPDSVTARGTKHLGELQHMVKAGQRAVMLYLVQRTDCTHFDVAHDIDPAYAAAYQNARAIGVELRCFAAQISPERIDLGAELAIMD